MDSYVLDKICNSDLYDNVYLREHKVCRTIALVAGRLDYCRFFFLYKIVSLKDINKITTGSEAL